MTAKDALNKVLSLEEELNLYDFEINSIKLWILYRTPYRYRYVSRVTGVPSITNREGSRSKTINKLFKLYKSVVFLIKVLLKHKKNDNIVFPFARLQYSQEEIFDKFTDPVIDASNIKDSVCIINKFTKQVYDNKRRHFNAVFPVDFLYLLTYILLPIYSIYHILSGNCFLLLTLYRRARSLFFLSYKDLLLMNYIYMKFRIMSLFYTFLFRRMGARRVFGVARRDFFDAIYSAHKLGIPVFEFQHGVTHGNTEYYSGRRCDLLDPDFFLAFGELWNGSQFGIDPSRIINIGWAYKEEIRLSQNEVIPFSVLFISSPEITHKILKTAEEFACTFPQYRCFIRCHPFEKYSKEQMHIVESTPNLFMDDNSIDSLMALCKYQFIVGENSSVVYEALSLGKIVGRLCYNGIESVHDNIGIDDGFVYIYGIEDFSKMLSANRKTDGNLAYSSFKREVVNKLPHK